MSDEPSDEDAERADRIRGARKGRRRRGRGQQTSQTPEAEQSEQTSQEPQTTQMSDDTQTASAQTPQEQQTDEAPQTEQAAQTPVTERNHDTFYLRDDLRDHLDLGVDSVNIRYRREYGAKLELNRHLRPLLLYLGLERLEEMDADEIHATLAETDLLDDPPGESV